jgi:hypothetical protein
MNISVRFVNAGRTFSTANRVIPLVMPARDALAGEAFVSACDRAAPDSATMQKQIVTICLRDFISLSSPANDAHEHRGETAAGSPSMFDALVRVPLFHVVPFMVATVLASCFAAPTIRDGKQRKQQCKRLFLFFFRKHDYFC